MNMLMQIRLKLPQPFEKRDIRRTYIRRWREVVARLPHLGQQSTRSVMFLHHHRNGIRYPPKTSMRPRTTILQRILELRHIREENQLLFSQVLPQLFIQLRQQSAQYRQFHVRRAMSIHNLVAQHRQPW